MKLFGGADKFSAPTQTFLILKFYRLILFLGIGFCMMSYNEKIRIISIFDKNILATDELVDEFNKMVIEEMETLRMYI